VIYAQILPGLESTPGQLFLGTAAFVVVNAAAALRIARAARGIEPTLLAFTARVLMNVLLLLLAAWLLPREGGGFDRGAALFFVLLLSLLTLLDDRYRPIYQARFATALQPTATAR
jgi:hypothetical protein